MSKTPAQETFEHLFRAHFSGLCVFATHFVPEEVAADVVQDAFLKAWEGRGRLDPERSIKAYLYRAVRNNALNYLKHRRIQERAAAELLQQAEAPRSDVEEALAYNEFQEALQRAIEQLPERRRLAYQLARQHGCTYDEIAEILGITRKSVTVQIGRALTDLRAALSKFFIAAL